MPTSFRLTPTAFASTRNVQAICTWPDWRASRQLYTESGFKQCFKKDCTSSRRRRTRTRTHCPTRRWYLFIYLNLPSRRASYVTMLIIIALSRIENANTISVEQYFLKKVKVQEKKGGTLSDQSECYGFLCNSIKKHFGQQKTVPLERWPIKTCRRGQALQYQYCRVVLPPQTFFFVEERYETYFFLEHALLRV